MSYRSEDFYDNQESLCAKWCSAFKHCCLKSSVNTHFPTHNDVTDSNTQYDVLKHSSDITIPLYNNDDNYNEEGDDEDKDNVQIFNENTSSSEQPQSIISPLDSDHLTTSNTDNNSSTNEAYNMTLAHQHRLSRQKSTNSTSSHQMVNSPKKVVATVMRYHLFRHVVFMVLFMFIFLVTFLDSINQKISAVKKELIFDFFFFFCC